MDTHNTQLRDRLEEFLASHLSDLEIEERVEALTWYCVGLGLELPKKTSLGMAEYLNPDNVQGCRQRMQRAVNRSRFKHTDIFHRLQRTVFESGRASAYCIDDTGFAKKGDRSVGVQRQYSGTLGKVGNCQIAVSLHGVSEDFSSCLGAQVYLPESWTGDPERLRKAKVPEEICFQPKWKIALGLIEEALENNGPRLPTIADAGYGDSREFRESLRGLGLHYAVAISSKTNVWPPGVEPVTPKRTGKVGRPRQRPRPNDGSRPVPVDRLASELWEEGRFREVTWRKGTKGKLRGQFCAVRVRSAESWTKGKAPGEEQWLLLEEDPKQETGFKYYLSTLQRTTSLKKLVGLAKLRWRIERDYQDMKQKLGLDRYEGRTWGGFHRHIAMVALVHAFLALNREAFSPDGEQQSVDLERFSPGASGGADALARPVPDMPPPL